MSFTAKTNRKILDIVLDIMDEGPRPMKNLKATEKNRNCVDQFWDAHQAEYEARSKMSEDRVGRVDKHSLAYPRLTRELDKRRSLTKVKKNKRHASSQQPICEMCIKRRRMSELQQTKQTKCKRNNRTKKRSRDIKTKNKNKRMQNRMAITSVNRHARRHYYSVKHKLVGSDVFLNFEPKSIMTDANEICTRETVQAIQPKRFNPKYTAKLENSIDNIENDINDKKSEAESQTNTFKNPDTSVASMSSYNSYYSFEHEPMVN